MDNPADPNQFTLVEHLTELRKRVINSFIAIAIGFVACWNFSDKLFDIMRRPISPYLGTNTGGLIFTAPMDKFLAHLKVSFLGGVILTAPLWLYQLWKFISPGLYNKERKYGVIFIFSGTFLFLTGVVFVYFLVFPLAFKFLMGFGGPTDVPMITISEYLSFFTTTTLVFGLAFEMPLILVILGIMGIIDHHTLASKRRIAILVMSVFAALVTPPDALSMLLLLIPLLLLYEISILLVRFFALKPEEELAEEV